MSAPGRKFPADSLSMPVCATAETLGIEDADDLRVLYTLAGMYADDMWRRPRRITIRRQDHHGFIARHGGSFYDRMATLLAQNLLRSITHSRGVAGCGS